MAGINVFIPQVTTDFINSSGVFASGIAQIRLDFENSSGVFIKDGESIGPGVDIFFQKDAPNQTLEFRTLTAGSGIEFIVTSGNIEICNGFAVSGIEDLRDDLAKHTLDFTNSSGIFQTGADCAAQVKLDFANSSGVFTSLIILNALEILRVETNFLNSSGIFQTGADVAAQVRLDFDNSSGVFRIDIDQNVTDISNLRTDFTNSSGIFQAGADCAVQVKTDFGNSSGVFRSDIDEIRTDFDNSSGIFQAGTDTANQVRTDFDNASGIFVKDGENIGTGSGVFIQKDSEQNLEFRTLIPGNGIGINTTASGELELFVESGAESTSAQNVGIGSGEVFAQEIVNDLQFRRLLAGSGIFISTSGNTVRIDNTLEDDLFILEAEHDQLRLDFDNSSGIFQQGTDTANEVRTDFDNSSGVWVENGENVGTGSGLFKQKDSERNLEFRTLKPGLGILLTQTADEIEITSLTAADATTAINVGIGSGEVFAQEVINELQFRRLLAGSGIFISTSGNTVRIDSTLEDDVQLIITDFNNSSGVFVKGAENLGGGQEAFIQKDADQNLEFRTFVGGSGVIVSTSGLTIRFDNILVDDFINLQSDVTELRTDFDNSSGVFRNDIDEIRLDFDNASGVWVKDGENLGAGSGIFVTKDAEQNLEFRTIIPGNGIGINQTSGTLEFFVVPGAESTTAINVGIGSGEVFAQKVGNDLQFRRILAGSGIIISTSGNTVRIDSALEDDVSILRTDVDKLRTDFDNSSGVFQGGVDTANQVRTDFDNASGIWVKDGENLGAGSGVFKQKDADENLEFRTLVPGSGIAINQSATELEIFSTREAEATTASNVGIGSGFVFAQEVGNDLQFRRLLAGSSIFITTSGNTVKIDIGPSGNFPAGLGNDAQWHRSPSGRDVLRTSSSPFIIIPSGQATANINFNEGYNFKVVLGQDMTFNLHNPLDGERYLFHIKQDAVGGRNITWPSGTNGVIWPSGNIPTITSTANARDIITLFYDSEDQKYFGLFSQDFF